LLEVQAADKGGHGLPIQEYKNTRKVGGMAQVQRCGRMVWW
jgi:hypothetical protein